MKIIESDPEDFEPQLLGYFTPREITLPRGPEESKYLTIATRAFTAVCRTGLAPGSLEGVQVWSTHNPNVSKAEVIMRNPTVSTHVRPVSTNDRQALLDFFRGNVRDIPAIAEGWFNIPYPLDSVDLSFEYAHLQGDLRAEAETWLDYTRQLVLHPALEAIQFANRRIREAETRFTGEDLQIARFWDYAHRAGMQGFLLERGGFRNLPIGNKLRSLCLLSEAVDLMRADTLYGSLTLFRGRKISECFANAGMKGLQLKVLERMVGEPSTERGLIPQDPEIAYIQKRIMARVPSVNL